MNSIETKNINIAYGNVNIVEDLNLEIPKGKITTIIGANGCGKSTILKTIARILKAKSGDIYINSKNINEQSSKEIARNMAVLPQSPQAPGGLTVEELIAYGRFPHQSGFKNNKQEDKEIVDWALKATGISEFRDRKIEDLSGGQRQRAWIAMALAQQTDILVLDEPTTYLDLFITGVTNNYPNYSSEAYDTLMERIDKGDLVYDVEARWEAMKEAEAILLGEDAALAPLYQQGNTYLINPKLKGVETHSVGVPFIYRNASIED